MDYSNLAECAGDVATPAGRPTLTSSIDSAPGELTCLTPEHDRHAGAEPAKKLLKVLHIVNGEYYSGAERVQDNLALVLPALGYEVGFVCVKPGRFPEARQSKKSPLYCAPMRSWWDFSPLAMIEATCRREEITLLHAHTPRTALLAARAGGRLRLPWVYHAHSPTLRDSERWAKNVVVAVAEWWAVRRADRVIAVSESLRRYWIRLGFSPHKVLTVPNGVPIRQTVAEREPPRGNWVLGTVALFRPRKGMEVLLEAASHLVKRGHSLRLLAVGPFESSVYERHLKEQAKNLGLEHVVEWTGFIREIDPVLDQMDLFVLPSLFGEGMPMVVLEALAAGLPVVASAVEGIPEVIRDGQEGYLVPPGSPEALAAAIERFFTGQADWQAMRRSAMARQRECFSTESMARAVADVYRAVLEEYRTWKGR